MTLKKRTEIENYFDVQTFNYVVVGIWFNVDKMLNISPKIVRILNWIYDIFILSLLSHILILYIVTLKVKLGQKETSFNEITDAVSQINVYGFASFMHYYCRIRSKRHIELLSYINQHFRFRSAKGLTYVTSEKVYSITKNLSFYWTICGVASTLQFGLYPIIIQKRILPLKLIYPFETLESPTYEILMTLQSIAQVSVGCGFLVCVNYGSVVAMLIGSQFDILNCSLKNILHTAMFKAGEFAELRNIGELSESVTEVMVGSSPFSSEDLIYFLCTLLLRFLQIQEAFCLGQTYLCGVNYRKLQAEHTFEFDESNEYYLNKEKVDNLDDSVIVVANGENRKMTSIKSSSSTCKPKLDNELYEALRENVLHHETIIKACKMLEDIMNPVILVKYIQVTTLLCTMFVTILKISGPVMITFIQYMAMAIFDLGMLCYSGEILKGESIKVGNALLRSPWYRFDVKFQRLIIIVLANTQKSLIITGGKFFDLGWDLFVTSLKLSFSCFTLLNKLGNK